MLLNDPKEYFVASKRLSRYSSVIENELMQVETAWCRMVYSDFESMLSPETWHPVYEIHYVMSGSIVLAMMGRNIAVNAGEFLIIPPKTIHATLDNGVHTQKMVFAFEIESKSTYVTQVLKTLEDQIQVYQSGDSVDSLIRALLSYAYRSDESSATAIRCIRELLLLDFFNSVLPSQNETEERINVFESDRRINDILSYIREHVTENITAEDVSNRLHLCQRHLNRLTKKQTGSIMRTESQPAAGYAAMLELTPDGKNYLPVNECNSLLHFPTSVSKFVIRQDPVTGWYFSLTSQKTIPWFGDQRSVLTLVWSKDLFTWKTAEILLTDREMMNPICSSYAHSFQYVDFVIDGEDILMAVREAAGRTNIWHDGTHITFYRLKNFRDMAK